VQRGLQGTWLGEEAVGDWVEEIREGISRGFINHDSTLDYYKQHTWYPRWFERGAIGPWLNKGQPTLSAALKREARRRIASHAFELDAEKRRALDEIYQSAQRTLI
jgi:trimethylamine:corrinoid methyltransferase-like protein